MVMNAVLAIVADGGRGIVLIYREAVQINYFLLYFIIYTNPFDGGLIQPLSKRLPGVGYVFPSTPCH